MDRTSDNNIPLYSAITERIMRGIDNGDYALLGVYLPEQVLHMVADRTGERYNTFGCSNGRAELKIVSHTLSRVLDSVRSSVPNRRWCVLAKNIAHIFEITRGSLCGADLSGLDLTECDFSTTALSSMGLKANFEGSTIRFDSFIRYGIPGVKAGEKPELALDVGAKGSFIMGCRGAIMQIEPENPLKSRLLCDISTLIGENRRICKLRYSLDERIIHISTVKDIEAYDRATSLHPCSDENLNVRTLLYDGSNIILCHDERESGVGAVMRRIGNQSSAYLESRELARFRERHCSELETGDPVRDELSARDRVFSADLRYKYENNRITDRVNRKAIAFVYAGQENRFREGKELCSLNATAADCSFDKIYSGSPITAEQTEMLGNKQREA